MADAYAVAGRHKGVPQFVPAFGEDQRHREGQRPVPAQGAVQRGLDVIPLARGQNDACQRGDGGQQ